MKKTNTGKLILALCLPLLTGIISAALSDQGMKAYEVMNKPPLSPPSWVFSVVWTILYLMMGLASYFIITSESDDKGRKASLTLYAVQLAMNFMWSIIFFNWRLYLIAFIWLLVMWFIVIACAFRFFSISRKAAYIMIPYILWLTFAAYLNLGAYMISISGKY